MFYNAYKSIRFLAFAVDFFTNVLCMTIAATEHISCPNFTSKRNVDKSTHRQEKVRKKAVSDDVHVPTSETHVEPTISHPPTNMPTYMND